MSKKIAGFDIGGHALHLVVATKKTVKKAVTVNLPEGAVRDGKIVSYEALGDFIKQTRKKYKLHFKNAAVILPSELCFCRRLSMPVMSHEQLMVNLPYEFRDFITAEKDAYYYDYAVLRVLQGDEQKPAELDLMAAAALKSTISDYKNMFKRAAIKLQTAIPIEMAYINLMKKNDDPNHCHCLIDLGHSSIRLYMFNGGRFESSHVIDYGCSALDDVIAEALGVDPFIAVSYREANHDDCQSLPECMNIYQNLAVEIQRAIHFFRYNSPDAELEHIHLSGGGAKIQPLRETLETTLSIPVLDASEILSFGGSDTELSLGAAGVAFQ